MKSQAKAVIQPNADDRTFYKDGILTLQFSGAEHKTVKDLFTLRGLRPGSVIVTSFTDRESKTVQQLRTIHLLIKIYDKYLQAHVDGYIDITWLKNSIKYKYGVIQYWEAPDRKAIATLKSFAEYTLQEMRPVIDGLIDEMNNVFAESGYSDKRFDEMLQEFNSQKIESKPDKLELF